MSQTTVILIERSIFEAAPPAVKKAILECSISDSLEDLTPVTLGATQWVIVEAYPDDVALCPPLQGLDQLTSTQFAQVLAQGAYTQKAMPTFDKLGNAMVGTPSGELCLSFTTSFIGSLYCKLPDGKSIDFVRMSVLDDRNRVLTSQPEADLKAEAIQVEIEPPSTRFDIFAARVFQVTPPTGQAHLYMRRVSGANVRDYVNGGVALQLLPPGAVFSIENRSSRLVEGGRGAEKIVLRINHAPGLKHAAMVSFDWFKI